MIDFNINHYLAEEHIEEKDPHRFDDFVGSIEEKPVTERELFKLQAEFLQTRSSATWNKMFELCWNYMMSLIKKRLSGKMYLEPSELMDKATAATVSFMNQYITNPNFEVGASFAGMMKWKVVEVLYKKNINDQAISINSEFNEDNSTTLEDLISDENAMDDLTYSLTNYNLMTTFEDVLRELGDVLGKNSYNYCMVYLFVYMFIRKPKHNFKKDFIKNWNIDYKLEKVIDATLLEIRNRIVGNY